MRRERGRSRRKDQRSQGGFSLLELIIALFIAVEILIAMGIAFDLHNKTARVQLQVADMQQALRIGQWDIARMLREAGRGGLRVDLEPGANFFGSTTVQRISGRAIEVRNNVSGAELDIARGVADSPNAFPGTDILTVRGCFSNQLFQINPATFDADADEDDVPGSDGNAASAGDDGEVTLTIPPVSIAGVPQPFAGDAIEGGGVVLMGSYLSGDDWGIGTTVGSPTVDGSGNLVVTLQIGYEPNATPSPLNPWLGTDPDDATVPPRRFPLTMAVTQACLLEEYRYYIRDVREPSDPYTPLRPRLTRARFEPGTELPYELDDANYALDLADQVFDLQIALGVDSDNNGAMDDDGNDTGLDEEIWEGVADVDDRSLDDWLYNDAADSAVLGCDPYEAGCDSSTNEFSFHAADDEPVDIYFVRVTTAARTARPEIQAGSIYHFRAPDLDTRASGDFLEDHDYDDSAEAAAVFNDEDNRKHRRRTLTTVVEMRNI